MTNPNPKVGTSAAAPLALSARTAAFVTAALGGGPARLDITDQGDWQQQTKLKKLLKATDRQLLFVTHVKLVGGMKDSTPAATDFGFSFFYSDSGGDAEGDGGRRSSTFGAESSVWLSVFPSLQYLEVDGASVDCLEQLLPLRSQLKVILVNKCAVPELAHLLLRGGAEESKAAAGGAVAKAHPTEDLLAAAKDSAESLAVLASMPSSITPPITWQWRTLTTLELQGCGLASLDASLRLAPNLTRLVLADNSVTELPAAIGFCTFLEYLDLSGNPELGPVLPMAPECLGAIKTLLLRGCGIRSCMGLDRLYGIEVLDMRDNKLIEISEVNRVAKLPFVKTLDLRGCPVCETRTYRIRVLALMQPFRSALAPTAVGAAAAGVCLEPGEYPVLDGESVTLQEEEKLLALAAVAKRARLWAKQQRKKDYGRPPVERPERQDIKELLAYSPYFYTFSRAVIGAQPAKYLQGLEKAYEGHSRWLVDTGRAELHQKRLVKQQRAVKEHRGSRRPSTGRHGSVGEIREHLAAMAHSHYRASHGCAGATPDRQAGKRRRSTFWRKNGLDMYIYNDIGDFVGWRRRRQRQPRDGMAPMDLGEAKVSWDRPPPAPVYGTPPQRPKGSSPGFVSPSLSSPGLSSPWGGLNASRRRVARIQDSAGSGGADPEHEADAATGPVLKPAVIPKWDNMGSLRPESPASTDASRHPLDEFFGDETGAAATAASPRTSADEGFRVDATSPLSVEADAEGAGGPDPRLMLSPSFSDYSSSGYDPEVINEVSDVGDGLSSNIAQALKFNTVERSPSPTPAPDMAIEVPLASDYIEDSFEVDPLAQTGSAPPRSASNASNGFASTLEEERAARKSRKESLLARVGHFQKTVSVELETPEKLAPEAASRSALERPPSVPERKESFERKQSFGSLKGGVAESPGRSFGGSDFTVPQRTMSRTGSMASRTSRATSVASSEVDLNFRGNIFDPGMGFGQLGITPTSSMPASPALTAKSAASDAGDMPDALDLALSPPTLPRSRDRTISDISVVSEGRPKEQAAADLFPPAVAEPGVDAAEAALPTEPDHPSAAAGPKPRPEADSMGFVGSGTMLDRVDSSFSVNSSRASALGELEAPRVSKTSEKTESTEPAAAPEAPADESEEMETPWLEDPSPYGVYVGAENYRDVNVRGQVKLYLEQNIFSPRAAPLHVTCRGITPATPPTARASDDYLGLRSSIGSVDDYGAYDGSFSGGSAAYNNETLAEIYHVPAMPVEPRAGSGAAAALHLVRKRTPRGEQLKEKDGADRDTTALEISVVVVLTDKMMYIMEDFWQKADTATWPRDKYLDHATQTILSGGERLEGESCRFGDAPRPRILAAHSIGTLSRIVIGFYFQRVRFRFRRGRRNARLSNSFSPGVGISDAAAEYDCGGLWCDEYGGSQDEEYEYVFCPRNRADTYKLSKGLPKLAAAAAEAMPGPMRGAFDEEGAGKGSYVYENEDNAVLAKVSNLVTELNYFKKKGAGGEASQRSVAAFTPLYYTMVYQRWKTRPGVLAPRTLIVTEAGLILCNEDYANVWSVARDEVVRRKFEEAAGRGVFHRSPTRAPGASPRSTPKRTRVSSDSVGRSSDLDVPLEVYPQAEPSPSP